MKQDTVTLLPGGSIKLCEIWMLQLSKFSNKLPDAIHPGAKDVALHSAVR